MVARIQVPPSVGPEVRVSVNGGAYEVYPVVDGVIEVPDDDPRMGERTPAQTVLMGIPGATLLDEPSVLLVSRLPNPAVEGVPLVAYGDSYVSAGTAPQPETQYLPRVAKRLNMPLDNRGVGASEAVDVVGQMLQGAPWVPGTRAVVVVDIPINNVRFYGLAAGALQAFRDSVLLMLKLLTSSVKREQSHASVVFSAGWIDGNALPNMSGGTAAFTETPGAYADITFTGDSITVLSLRYRQGSAGGTIELVNPVGGAVYSEHSGTGGLPATSTEGYHQLPLELSGLGAGSHTVRVRKKVGDASAIWLDGYLLPGITPPPVFLMKGVPLDWTQPTNVNGSNAILEAYNDALEEVAAPFPSVAVVDTPAVTGFAKGGIYSGDTVHLNNRGNSAYVEILVAPIAALPYDAGLNYL